MGLNLRIKPKKRLLRDNPDLQVVPDTPNEAWSMDFMADQLADGRKSRTMKVLVGVNREGLCIERFFQFPARHRARVCCARGGTTFRPNARKRALAGKHLLGSPATGSAAA